MSSVIQTSLRVLVPSVAAATVLTAVFTAGWWVSPVTFFAPLLSALTFLGVAGAALGLTALPPLDALRDRTGSDAPGAARRVAPSPRESFA
jgi:hypothetical protein